MKIFLLDDDVDLLNAVRRMLQTSGHEVDISSDAKDAATTVGCGDYDVVLVDYKMPERDGAWFMRNCSIPAKTKVLLCSAYATKDVLKQMFALGASGYIMKPFDEADLLHNINFHAGEGKEDGGSFDSVPA